MVENLKLEIDFQDMQVPIYTAFEDMERGPLAIYGIKAQNGGFLRANTMMGRDGHLVYCLPKIGSELGRIKDKLDSLPVNSLAWAAGKYNGYDIKVQSCGSSEEFPNQEMSRRLADEFRRYLDPDVFKFDKKGSYGARFEVNGKVRVDEINGKPDVAILDRNDRKVATIVSCKESFVPFNGGTVRFPSYVGVIAPDQQIKLLYPDIDSQMRKGKKILGIEIRLKGK